MRCVCVLFSLPILRVRDFASLLRERDRGLGEVLDFFEGEVGGGCTAPAGVAIFCVVCCCLVVWFFGMENPIM